MQQQSKSTGGSGYQRTHLSMDSQRRQLLGSDVRDLFRHQHKNDLPHHMMGTDIDFVIIEKNPHMIVAFLDIKVGGDSLTFTEIIAYNECLKHAPVYIVYASSRECVQKWCFGIYRYITGNPVPNPPTKEVEKVAVVNGVEEFAQWEQSIRDEAKAVRLAKTGKTPSNPPPHFDVSFV